MKAESTDLQEAVKVAERELEELDLLYWCYEILMERSGLDETELDDLCEKYDVKVTLVLKPDESEQANLEETQP